MSTKKPPSILYHYTSQEGLLGIIKNGEVWATDILYLNDTMEYKYAVDLTLKVIKERQKLLNPENHLPLFSSAMEPSKKSIVPDFPYRYSKKWIEYNMLDDLRLTIQESDEYHIFVFSLSKNGNLLSQWRGYCPHGNGYSIGFKTSDFSSQMTDRGLRFVECVYEKGQQDRMINGFIERYVKDIRKNYKDLSESVGHRIDLMTEYLNDFLLIASILKNKSFKEEEEWRLVTKPLGNHTSIRFREGASTIIPYIPINISGTKNFPIKQIIIGPTSNKQLSEKAIGSLLSCKNIESCNVKTSNISYRIS